MASFEIADCPTRVSLKEETRSGALVQAGVLTLTVRNTTDRRQNARLRIEPAGATKAEWLSFEGAPATGPREIEREFDPRATQTHRVNVAVPVGAAPGPQLFNVRVTAEDDPDNDYVVGPSVAFDVAKWAEAPPPPASFPWWAIAVAAAVVLIVGGVVGWLLWPDGPRQINVVGKTETEARMLLREAGFADANIHVQTDAMASGQQPATVARTVYAPENPVVDVFLDPGIVVPAAVNRAFEDVAFDFNRAGLAINQVTRESRPGFMDGFVISTTPVQGARVAGNFKTPATIIVHQPRPPTNCTTRPWLCELLEGANAVVLPNGSVNTRALTDSVNRRSAGGVVGGGGIGGVGGTIINR